jgi:hypothetical protein
VNRYRHFLTPRRSRASFALTSFFCLLLSGYLACQPAVAFVEETQQKAANTTSLAAKNPDAPISKLELRLFDFTYQSDSKEARLKRLENFVFGATQTGSDDERLANLEKSVTERKSTTAANSNPPVTTASSSTTQDSLPPTENAAPFNYTDYPRVDQLEQAMLGRQFHEDSLPVRLSQLETKAFGHPSTSNDLASRVDTLDNFLNRNDIYGERNTIAQAPHYAPVVTGNYSPTTAPPPPNPYLQSNVVSTNDRVDAMEKAVFGHDYASRSLKDRVERLEKKIIPYKHDQESQSLPVRVDQLWSILGVANSLKSAPFAANPQNADFSQASYGYTNTQLANNQLPQTVAQKPHHSWLHKVGHVLGTAAIMAASSGMMGMGGMGYGGMGYGGYNGIGGF